MKALKLAPAILLFAFAAPAAAQGIPDYIPDTPGESLVDREKEKQEERHRGVLSRFFAGGSVDMAPLASSGFGVQTNVTVGMALPEGDAILLTLANRETLTSLRGEPVQAGGALTQAYVGVGYEVGGARVFGSESRLADRSALGVGLGLLFGDTPVMAMDITPTYRVFQRGSLSVPVGVRFSLAAVGPAETRVTRAFVGLEIGARFHWVNHDRMD